MPVIFPSFVAERGNDVSRFVADRGWKSPRIAELWRGYQSLASTEHRKAFVRTVRSVIDPGGQTVSAMDRIYLAAKLPTLIVWGDDDPIIPVSHAHAAHEALPGSRLEVLDGCGHFPHVESPQRFVTVLDDFLTTTEPAHVHPEDFRQLLVGQSPDQ
jgi:pimeloyl-ACP methyl ester carboxylesterase